MKRLWNVRRFNTEDQKGVIDLLNLVFSINARLDTKLWLWKYKNNPYGSLEVVAQHQSHIVGHMGLVGADLKVGNRTIKAAQAVDLAVNPDLRRQGMFLALGKTLMEEASKESIAVAYGIPNEPAYYGHLQYGWFYVSRIPVLTKFLKANSLFRFLLIKLYYFIRRRYSPVSGLGGFQLFPFLKNMISWMSSPFTLGEIKSDKTPLNKDLRVRQITEFEGRFDQFWNVLSKQFAVVVERNRRYLNWRYCEKPGSRYKVFIAERDGHLQGYLVLTVEKPWDWATLSLKKLGYIVDLMSASKKATKCLIQEAINYFASKQVDLVLCWMMPGGFAYEQLLEKGFRYDKTLQESVLICRVNFPLTEDARLDEMREGRNWFLTIGDSDLV